MRRTLGTLGVALLLMAACGDGVEPTASTGPAVSTTAPEVSRTTTTVAETTTSATPATTTTADLTPRPGGTVVIADDQEPPTLNPYVPGGDTFIVGVISQAHMAGAYDIDAATLEFIPELVVEVPTMSTGGVVINDDGSMTVRWEIRDEALWSDGTPVSGDDFAFTVDYQTATAECWDEDADWVPEPFDLGGEVETVDAKTISVRFDQPGFQHEEMFQWIVPKHAVEGTDYCDDWNDTTWPAAGPFMVAEWQRGDHVKLVRNPNYWKNDHETGIDLPYLDGVEFRFLRETEEIVRAFRARDIDVAQPPPALEIIRALQDLEGADVQVLSGRVWEHFNFQFGPNNRNPDSMNESRSFRQAVGHALDRAALVEAVCADTVPPIDGFLHTVIPDAGSNPWTAYDHNPERAVDLVEKACEELARDCAAKPPQMIFSTTHNGDIRVRWADMLQDMLADSGIELELQLEDSQVFFGDTFDNGDWDLGLWAWAGGQGATGALSMMELFDPDGLPPDGANYYRWGTPDSSVRDDEAVATFRDVLAEMRSTYDYDEVKRLAGALERQLAEEAVIIPLASRLVLGAVWADEISGFQMNSTQAALTWNIELWRRIDL